MLSDVVISAIDQPELESQSALLASNLTHQEYDDLYVAQVVAPFLSPENPVIGPQETSESDVILPADVVSDLKQLNITVPASYMEVESVNLKLECDHSKASLDIAEEKIPKIKAEPLGNLSANPISGSHATHLILNTLVTEDVLPLENNQSFFEDPIVDFQVSPEVRIHDECAVARNTTSFTINACELFSNIQHTWVGNRNPDVFDSPIPELDVLSETSGLPVVNVFADTSGAIPNEVMLGAKFEPLPEHVTTFEVPSHESDELSATSQMMINESFVADYKIPVEVLMADSMIPMKEKMSAQKLIPYEGEESKSACQVPPEMSSEVYIRHCDAHVTTEELQVAKTVLPTETEKVPTVVCEISPLIEELPAVYTDVDLSDKNTHAASISLKMFAELFPIADSESIKQAEELEMLAKTEEPSDKSTAAIGAHALTEEEKMPADSKFKALDVISEDKLTNKEVLPVDRELTREPSDVKEITVTASDMKLSVEGRIPAANFPAKKLIEEVKVSVPDFKEEDIPKVDTEATVPMVKVHSAGSITKVQSREELAAVTFFEAEKIAVKVPICSKHRKPAIQRASAESEVVLLTKEAQADNLEANLLTEKTFDSEAAASLVSEEPLAVNSEFAMVTERAPAEPAMWTKEEVVAAVLIKKTPVTMLTEEKALADSEDAISAKVDALATYKAVTRAKAVTLISNFEATVQTEKVALASYAEAAAQTDEAPTYDFGVEEVALATNSEAYMLTEEKAALAADSKTATLTEEEVLASDSAEEAATAAVSEAFKPLAAVSEVVEMKAEAAVSEAAEAEVFEAAVVEAPADVSEAALAEAPAEVSEAAVAEAPAEVSEAAVAEAPAEVSEAAVAEAPAEVSEAAVAEAPAEVSEAAVAEAPAEVSEAAVAEAPAEVSEAALAEAPAEVSEAAVAEAPAEVSEAAVAEAPAEVSEAALAEAPAEVSEAALAEAPAEVSEAALAEAPAEVSEAAVAEASAEVSEAAVAEAPVAVSDAAEAKASASVSEAAAAVSEEVQAPAEISEAAVVQARAAVSEAAEAVALVSKAAEAVAPVSKAAEAPAEVSEAAETRVAVSAAEAKASAVSEAAAAVSEEAQAAATFSEEAQTPAKVSEAAQAVAAVSEDIDKKVMEDILKANFKALAMESTSISAEQELVHFHNNDSNQPSTLVMEHDAPFERTYHLEPKHADSIISQSADVSPKSSLNDTTQTFIFFCF
ncbi:uncharacterized protein ACMZJ9_002591 [Mantella aurantiaca]